MERKKGVFFMANDRVFNFSAGPSMLPLEVLQRAGAEITNYGGSGMSVMEMSHRSKVFLKILTKPRKSSAGSWVCPRGTRFSSFRAAAPCSLA